MFFPPSLSQTRDTVIKEKMLLPEASSPSLPLSLHPHPTLSCYGGDAFTTEFCFELLSLSFYSLSLSCFVLLPISPPSLWIEKERCWFPKAGCSSLNNSSWFPVVLSPVLHQSITPLHKDVQMGWDPYVHAHFRQKHKHGPVRVPMVIHTAMHRVRKALVHTCESVHIHTKCVSWSSNKAPFTSCSVLFLLSQRVRQTFSNFPHLHRCFFFSLSVSPTQSLTRSLSYSIPPPLTAHPQAVNENTAQIGLPACFPALCSAEKSNSDSVTSPKAPIMAVK